jgi:hypothetical protein
LPPCGLPAALNAYNYTSNASGVTYVFNNTPVNSYDAQTACNTYGGHLVWFSSLQEQQEVERGFMAMGKLLPTFHTSYWIGYRAGKASINPADFKILDKTAGAQTYAHWGTFKPAPAGKDPAEPNNLLGGENCAVGNFTEMYANASGWADASCGLRLPFVCKLLGECGRSPRGLQLAARPSCYQVRHAVLHTPLTPILLSCRSARRRQHPPDHQQHHRQRVLSQHQPGQPDSGPADLQCQRWPPGRLLQPGGAGRGGELLPAGRLDTARLPQGVLDGDGVKQQRLADFPIHGQSAAR